MPVPRVSAPRVDPAAWAKERKRKVEEAARRREAMRATHGDNTDTSAQDALERHINGHHLPDDVGGNHVHRLAAPHAPGNDSFAMHVASAEAAVAAAEAAAAAGRGRGRGGGYADRHDRYAPCGYDHPASTSDDYDAASVPTPSPPAPSRGGGPLAGRRSRQDASSSKPEWDADTDVVRDAEAARRHHGVGASGGVGGVGSTGGTRTGGATTGQHESFDGVESAPRRVAAARGRRAGAGAGWNDDNTVSYSPPETLQRGDIGNGYGYGYDRTTDRPSDRAAGHGSQQAAAFGRRGASGDGGGGGGSASAPGGVRPHWDGDGAATATGHTQTLIGASERPTSNNGNRSVRTASKLAALKGRRRAAQAVVSATRPASRETETETAAAAAAAAAAGSALRQPRTLFDGAASIPGGGFGGGGRFDEDAPTSAASGNWDSSGPPPEYGEQEPLHQCGGCSRRFNSRALSVHARVCRKVFGGAPKGGGGAAAGGGGGGEWGHVRAADTIAGYADTIAGYGGGQRTVAVNGRRGGGGGGGGGSCAAASSVSRGDGANNDFDPYGGPSHGNGNGMNDRDGGSSEGYNPPSRQEQASRSRRPARLQHRQQQQSASPPQEPDTPSPVPAASTDPRDDGWRGCGGRGFGRDMQQPSSTVSLPPEMAGMVIPEGADAPPAANLTPCNLCGRKFNPKALTVHSRICAKVFATKRKKFDSTKARAEGTELAQFQRESGGGGGAGGSRHGGRSVGRSARQPLKQQRAAAAADERSAQGAAAKMPKWKRQSEMFRAGLRAARGDTGGGRGSGGGGGGGGGGMGGGGDGYAAPTYDDDRVSCPHCQRRFNEDVAERHIPHCKNMKAKPTKLVRGGGRGAHTSAPARKENSAPTYARKGVAAPRRSRAGA